MNQKKIPEFRLIAKPISDDAAILPKFKWAGNEIGTRHKIGGNPDFLQGNDIPVCPCCKKKMIFYSQIDSLSDDFVIADCGMIYTFICFDCNEVNSFIQSS